MHEVYPEGGLTQGPNRSVHHRAHNSYCRSRERNKKFTGIWWVGRGGEVPPRYPFPTRCWTWRWVARKPAAKSTLQLGQQTSWCSIYLCVIPSTIIQTPYASLLPSQLNDMQRTQIISIDPWNTYNIPWYFYHICNSSNSAPFFVSLIHIVLLGYHILPNVFCYNFLTRNVYWKFTSYFRSPIVSKSHPNFIHKETYFQCSPKIQTCFHYPIILKVTWHKSCINFWYIKILVKFMIRP